MCLCGSKKPQNNIKIVPKSNDYVNFYFRSSKPKSYQKQLMIKTPEIKTVTVRKCVQLYICEHESIHTCESVHNFLRLFFNHHAMAFTCPFCTKAGPPECQIS